VKKIYGVRVCLRIARGAWGCQRMTRLGWSRSVFGRENEVVVPVAQRVPVKSRLGTFSEVLSMPDRESEGA